MTGTGFTVYRNGQLVNESDLIATGDSPETPAPVQSEEWTLVEGHPQAGIACRWHKGKVKQYRAHCWIDDERFPGERGPVYSAIFKACDEADSSRIEGYSLANLQEEKNKREVDARVARALMDPRKDAAMSDMRRHLKDLEAEVMRPYFLWQQAQARHVERMSRTAALRETIDIMLTDINEHGSTPEYDTFIEQLSALLSRKSE